MLSRFARLAACIGLARARIMLVAGGLFIGLVLAGAMSWFLVSSRQAVMSDAVREMRNDALLLAEQEDRLLQSVDLMHISVIAHLRELGIDSADALSRFAGAAAMEHYLSERVAGLSYVTALMLFDADGKLLNASRSWPVPAVDSTEPDYVRAQMATWLPQPFLSGPALSKTTGKWTMYISRRFNGLDGRLAGILVGAIALDYFEQFYSRLPLTGGGSFVLYRRDGTLMARYPQVEGKVGQNYRAAMNFKLLVAALDAGSVRLVSTLDGRDRVMAPRTMEHFPLIVAVSDTVDSIFTAWNEQARVFAITTVLLELVLGATVLVSMRHMVGYERLQQAETKLAVAQERERADEAVHRQEHRLDMALHNMLQGLLMISHSGELLMVNRRFYQMFGMPVGSLALGIDYGTLTHKIVELGNVSKDDMRGIRDLRSELLARNARAVSTWQLSDGRAFNVTHQPMEEGWVTTYEEITERRQAEEKMVHLAHHDPLTDLPNRVLFHSKLREAMAFARRGFGLALFCLDLDRFKAINDTLGHPTGDALLRAIAQRLASAVRDTDTVARLGGDEFAIVQTTVTRASDVTSYANRIVDLLDIPFEVAGRRVGLSTSIGVALAPQDGTDEDELLRCASLALHRAKTDGCGACRLFQADMDQEMRTRRQLELDLRQALSAGEFEVYFQPQVDMNLRRVTAVEALLRWRHPERGFVSPAQFIPIAEEIGLIVPIGEWVLRQACATVASWPGCLRLAVNLSAAQFKGHELVATVRNALKGAGLPADRLELEITESAMLRDTEATLATLHQLRELGVRTAMDDFGTGYSSLSYLLRFPFDRIKIDQSFVRELSASRDSNAIVRAVTGLGLELGMATTAEGVETQQQLETLLRAGCTEFQGYLFSPAVTGDRIAATVAAIAETLRQLEELTPSQVAA